MMDLLGTNDVIHAYTAQYALADGVLHHPYPERWPWLLISQNVHAACSADPKRAYDHALLPLLVDAIVAAQAALARGCIERPLELHHTVAGAVSIVPNEMGGMTVYTPDED